MGRPTSKGTVLLTFAPDVMDAVKRFQDATMPEASVQAAVQELVIIGLARTAEEGAANATRRREARAVRRWAFRQLGLALNDLVEKVDRSAQELQNLELEEQSG